MHLAFFITTATFLLAQLSSLQTIALSSFFSINAYSSMPSSRPPTLPSSSTSPRRIPRRSDRISQIKSESTSLTTKARPAPNPLFTPSTSSAGSSQKPRSLLNTMIFPLSDTSTNIDVSILSTNPANMASRSNVSPPSTNSSCNHETSAQSSSSLPQKSLGSNTRRKRKAKDEGIRQAKLYPAQDQIMGPTSSSRNVESAIVDTPLQEIQTLIATVDTQQQQDRVHHAGASSSSALNIISTGEQQPENPFPTGDRATTDHDGPNRSDLHNEYLPSVNHTSPNPIPSIIDMHDNPPSPTPLQIQSPSRQNQQVEHNNAASERSQYRVVRNGSAGILSVKPKATVALDEEQDGDLLDCLERFQNPENYHRKNGDVTPKPRSSLVSRSTGSQMDVDSHQLPRTSNSVSMNPPKTTPAPAPSSPKGNPSSYSIKPTVIPKGLSFRKNNTNTAGIRPSSSLPSLTSKDHTDGSGSNSTSRPKSQYDKLPATTRVPPFSLMYTPPIFAGSGPNIIPVNIMRLSTPAPDEGQETQIENDEQPSMVVVDVHEDTTELAQDLQQVTSRVGGNVDVSSQNNVDHLSGQAESLKAVDGAEESDNESEEWEHVFSVNDSNMDVRDKENFDNLEIPLESFPITFPGANYPGNVLPAIPSPPTFYQPSSSSANSVPRVPLWQNSPSRVHPPFVPSHLTAGDVVSSLSSPPSVGNNGHTTSVHQRLPSVPSYYREEMQSDQRSPPSTIPSAPNGLPPAAAVDPRQEVPQPVPDESIGWGLQGDRVASRLNLTVSFNTASIAITIGDPEAYLRIPLPPSPLEQSVFPNDASMEDVREPDESSRTTHAQDMDVDPKPVEVVHDVSMADAIELDLVIRMKRLSISDPDERLDVEMGAVHVEADTTNTRMAIEAASNATSSRPMPVFTKVPARLLSLAELGQKLLPKPRAVFTPHRVVVKGTGPPQRVIKNAKAATIKVDNGVGFVPSYPAGTPFRLESCFHWPMDTTPDRDFSITNSGGYSSDDSMDWTSTDSSQSDVDMEDLTLPSPPRSNALSFNAPAITQAALTLKERPSTKSSSPTPLIVLPTASLPIPSPSLGQPLVDVKVDKPAPTVPVEASKETRPSTSNTAKEAPAGARAAAPEPKLKGVYDHSPDVRTSGGGTYSSFSGGEDLFLGQRCRKVGEFPSARLCLARVRPTRCLRGPSYLGPLPPTADEIRAHLNPHCVTPPPHATPQRAAADPKPTPAPSLAPGHAALITTVQPVAAEQNLHHRSSSAATIERAAARGLASNIPEENDQEGHSRVIDTGLGKKVKKSSARKSRKEGEKRSRKELVQPEVVTLVDPLSHAARWGVEKDSRVGSLYAGVSAVHDWLRQNPWYLIEWYLIMLALLFALGSRFFVTSLLLSLCVDPWFVCLRNGVVISASASVSLVVATVSSVRNTVARIRRSIGNLPIIGRLIR